MGPTVQPARIFIALCACLVSATACAQTDERTFERRREALVRAFIASPVLGREPVRNEAVLEAMRAVPRHRFVPARLREEAYRDSPLPIGHGQTISQPYIVARMTEAVNPKSGHKVLEVGTGSGYQAAVLAEIVDSVYTIEIVEPLGKRAAETLQQLEYENIQVRIGDGYRGWPEEAPFDAIIVTAAPTHVPQPLIDQLKTGGRMIIPVGPRGRVQELRLVTKNADGTADENILDLVRFVPFTGEAEQR